MTKAEEPKPVETPAPKKAEVVKKPEDTRPRSPKRPRRPQGGQGRRTAAARAGRAEGTHQGNGCRGTGAEEGASEEGGDEEGPRSSPRRSRSPRRRSRSSTSPSSRKCSPTTPSSTRKTKRRRPDASIAATDGNPAASEAQSSGYGQYALGHRHRRAALAHPAMLVGAAGRARGQHHGQGPLPAHTDGTVIGEPQVMNDFRRAALRHHGARSTVAPSLAASPTIFFPRAVRSVEGPDPELQPEHDVMMFDR